MPILLAWLSVKIYEGDHGQCAYRVKPEGPSHCQNAGSVIAPYCLEK